MRDVVLEVAAQGGDTGLVLQQIEGGEVRQRHTFVKDQRGLHSAVGGKELLAQLWQAVPVLAGLHGKFILGLNATRATLSPGLRPH